MEISGPLTAAAGLRERGEWSLDGPAMDFDACDWWWRLRFKAGSYTPDAVLGFDGVATRSAAWLNGNPLFESRSMFVPQRLRCGEMLREGDNELLIHCRALAPDLAARRPRPRWRVPMLEQQQLRWIRTSLLGHTSGWSPPAAPVGPWRDVWWARGGGVDDDLHIDARLLPDGCTGQVAVRITGAQDAGRGLRLVLKRGPQQHVLALERRADGSHAGTLDIDDVALWWPHTHGEPALYEATLEWEGDSARQARALAPIGFRSIELDTAGGRFQLRINGEPVFCRGACWMPLDPVSLRAGEQAFELALAQVRAAGMNMLRVPGTTVYEDEAFHRACDRHGVLVWQEFMFASMDYPEGDAAFDADVRAEAQAVLARLRRHASTAVLCGNSEVSQQAAMWGAPRALWEPPLFHETLPALCREGAPGIPYWPSSAHGGDFPHQANRGTTSYYGVGAYRRGLDDARASGLSFATECLAYANVPSRAALARMPGGLATRVHHPRWKQRSPRDLGAGWDFDDVRDHAVQALFGVDVLALRQHDHERYLALGRQATAEAMAAAYGQWRRAASGCGGALVLQLRDLWAGAGWGLLDEQGQPKACWHALSRALQPVAAWITDDGLNDLCCHVANDGPAALDATLELSAWRASVCVAQASRPLQLAARTVQAVGVATLFDHLLDLGWAWRFGPPACEAVVATLRGADGALLSQGFHFPQGPGLAQQEDVGLHARLLADPDRATDGKAMVEVSTRSLAVGVHFDIPGWLPEDDYFHLAPGVPRRVCLRRHQARAGARPEGELHALNASSSTPLTTATRDKEDRR